MAALQYQLMHQSPLNRPARCWYCFEVFVFFYGHNHQHVEQNCEGTSHDVNSDSSDITYFFWNCSREISIIREISSTFCKKKLDSEKFIMFALRGRKPFEVQCR